MDLSRHGNHHACKIHKKMKKTLVLNSSYEPLSIVGWRKGFVLCNFSLDGSPSARVEKNYKETFSTVSSTFKKPSVIVLRRQIPVRPRRVKLTYQAIFRRDSQVCQYCGLQCTSKVTSIDHIIPKSKGGKDTWRNLVTACFPCNNKKGSKTLDECGMSLSRLPFTPVWPNDPGIPSEWEVYLF